MTGSSTSERPQQDLDPSTDDPSRLALNVGDLRDPDATVFGALLSPLLPPGFELAFASDGPRPIAVALNAHGDRFEAAITSSDAALDNAAEIDDDYLVTVPEGTLFVEADRQSHDNAYLITDDAVITSSYVRLDERASDDGLGAVDIAVAIASDVPPELITGRSGSIGTGFARDVTEAVESIIATRQPADVSVLQSGVVTVEAVGTFQADDAVLADDVSIRVEMFDGYLAPRFLGDSAGALPARLSRRSSRIGTLLVIMTIESDDVSTQEALEMATLDSIAEILDT